MNFLTKTYRILLLGVHGVAGALLLFSAYAYLIPPDRWSLPLFFALSFPVFFFVEWGLVLLHLFLPPRKYIVLPILFLLLVFPAARNYFPIHTSGTDNGEPELTIVSYNVLQFERAREITKANPILRLLQESGADIVCIQEYPALGADAQKKFGKILSRYPYKYISEGLACYSVYPIVKAEPIRFAGSDNGACLYRLDVKGRKLSLVNCHLESNRLEKSDKELYVNMAMHPTHTNELLPQAKERLLRKVARSSAARAAQARMVREIIDRLTGAVIVCGDFNDTAQSYAYHTVRGDFGDAYAATAFGPDITYNAFGLWFRIDHILYNDSFHALDARIIHERYSDHYPIVATLQWNADD